MSTYSSDDDEQENKVHKLVEGISLNEFVNDKGVVFKINDEYNLDDWNFDNYEDTDDSDKVINELNRKNVAPPSSMNFEVLGVTMTNLDEKGYVKKEIITSGIGSPPPPHSRVYVHYSLYEEFKEEPFDSTYLRGRPCCLHLDSNEVIVGLETAIKSMAKKENSKFIIKWEVGFGKLGCPPRIGKESDILADVTLIDFKETIYSSEENALTEEEATKVNFKQHIKEAKNFYFSGCENFRSGNFKHAAVNYQKAVNVLNDMRLADEVEEQEMFSLKVKILLNLALSCSKMGRSEKTCKICREILSIDPNNVKAMFYYGKANLHLSNFEIAEKWLKRVQKLRPKNQDVNEALEKLHSKKETFQLEHKIFCRKAFGFK